VDVEELLGLTGFKGVVFLVRTAPTFAALFILEDELGVNHADGRRQNGVEKVIEVEEIAIVVELDNEVGQVCGYLGALNELPFVLDVVLNLGLVLHHVEEGAFEVFALSELFLVGEHKNAFRFVVGQDLPEKRPLLFHAHRLGGGSRCLAAYSGLAR